MITVACSGSFHSHCAPGKVYDPYPIVKPACECICHTPNFILLCRYCGKRMLPETQSLHNHLDGGRQ